ncbi:MAG TPA: nucleotidyltransferase family protein [Actinomycetes bacterium]
MPDRVLGVVLAAGRAARMGRAKQLAELDGRPLLEHVLAAMSAAPLDDLVVALGAYADEVLAGVDLHRARPLLVPDWEQGMGRVLAQALADVAADGDMGAPGAVVVALGDQPLVGDAVVGRLVDAWRRGAGPVVSAAYHGRTGHPKLFDRAVVDQLRGLAGDEGARGLLADHPEWVAAVEVGRLGSDLDVDDEAGLTRARDVLAARRGSPQLDRAPHNPTR